MAKGRSGWLIVWLVGATWWLAGCPGNPDAPGTSEFVWGIIPATLTVQQGAAGTFAIRLDSKVNINSNVSLSLSGAVPPNSTPTFNPVNLGSTGRDSTLTIQTTPQTPGGSYTLRVTASEIGESTHDIVVRVDVVGPTQAPDFLLEVIPTEITLTDPRVAGPTVQFIVRPINGFTGVVDISVDGLTVLPAPLIIAVPITPTQLTFASGDGGKGGTFVPALAQRDSYPATWVLTVRAASGSIVHTVPINFTIRVAAPD